MDIDELKTRLAAARNPLREWLDDAAALALPDHAMKVELLAQLSVAVEELGMASEGLEEQSELLLAARAGQETERQRYQELFESSPVACLITDRNGNLCQANGAAVALLGVPADELLGKPLTDFIAEEERKDLCACLARARDRAGAEPCELGLQAPGGRPRRASLSASALPAEPGQNMLVRWWIQETAAVLSAL